jgi:hypothetical protein
VTALPTARGLREILDSVCALMLADFHGSKQIERRGSKGRVQPQGRIRQCFSLSTQFMVQGLDQRIVCRPIERVTLQAEAMQRGTLRFELDGSTVFVALLW